MLPLLVAVLLAYATPPALSAREIYLRARAAVSAIPLPPYVIFTFTDATNYAVQVVGRRSSARERLRIAVRTSDGHAFVQTLRTWSGYVGRVPPVVVGDNAMFPNTGVYRLGDFPTADFGLRENRTRPGFLEAPSPPEPRMSGDMLKVIGTVSAIDLPYRLTRLADDTIDGRGMYHLSLVPLRDRSRNILREVWIDEETFEPRRYVVERFVGSPPAFSYLVHVDEARIAGFMLNTALTGFLRVPISVPRIVFAPVERTADVAWWVSDVSFPSVLPDWLFDPNAFKAHANDPIPVALAASDRSLLLPSVRHLVFDFSIATNTAQGQVAIDVVAATADGGLAVDVRQTPGDTAPPVRVGIASNGHLFYDAKVALTLPEIALLELLGRDVIGPTVRNPGETWDIPSQGSGDEEGSSFRVIGVPSQQNEVLDMMGPTRGTVTYNPSLSVPLSASLRIRSTTVDLTLVEDSLGAAK